MVAVVPRCPLVIDPRDRHVDVAAGNDGVGLVFVPEIGRLRETVGCFHEKPGLDEPLAERRTARVERKGKSLHEVGPHGKLPAIGGDMNARAGRHPDEPSFLGPPRRRARRSRRRPSASPGAPAWPGCHRRCRARTSGRQAWKTPVARWRGGCRPHTQSPRKFREVRRTDEERVDAISKERERERPRCRKRRRGSNVVPRHPFDKIARPKIGRFQAIRPNVRQRVVARNVADPRDDDHSQQIEQRPRETERCSRL